MSSLLPLEQDFVQLFAEGVARGDRLAEVVFAEDIKQRVFGGTHGRVSRIAGQQRLFAEGAPFAERGDDTLVAISLLSDFDFTFTNDVKSFARISLANDHVAGRVLLGPPLGGD